MTRYCGKLFVYKNKNDPFHRKIQECIHSIVRLKVTCSERELKQCVAQTDVSGRPLVLLDDFLSFQENFPDLFLKRGYQEDVEHLKKIPEHYQAEFKRIERSKSSQLMRPVESFQGSRLVIGCGQAMTSFSGHAEDYTLNFAKDTRPDLLADYFTSAYWKEFPHGKFNEVFFEGFIPRLTTHAFTQIARILAPEGKVRIGINPCKDLLWDGEQCLLKFSNQVVLRALRM